VGCGYAPAKVGRPLGGAPTTPLVGGLLRIVLAIVLRTKWPSLPTYTHPPRTERWLVFLPFGRMVTFAGARQSSSPFIPSLHPFAAVSEGTPTSVRSARPQLSAAAHRPSEATRRLPGVLRTFNQDLNRSTHTHTLWSRSGDLW
jgi:hypothetical protein